jgi:hypothetical protein
VYFFNEQRRLGMRDAVRQTLDDGIAAELEQPTAAMLRDVRATDR